MKEIKSSDCVIAFLDILGYETWVKEAKSPDEIFCIFEKILKNIELTKSKYVQAQQYFSYIDFTIWSDSLIYVLNLTGLDEETRSRVIAWFLYLISLSIMEFLADTGYFLRGGISYGDFLQKEILSKEHRFIFSQSYIDAVRLEKKAKTPRILLTKEFVEYKNKLQSSDILASKAIKQDIYEQYYLDFYSYLYCIPALADKYLKEIKVNLTNKYPGIKNDTRIRNKFLYFADYHNAHVGNIFRAKLLDEDFENPKFDRFHTLMTLKEVGIVEDTNDFFIKKDIKPNLPQIAQTLGHVFPSADGHIALLIAERIKRRIEEINIKVKDYSIVY